MHIQWDDVGVDKEKAQHSVYCHVAEEPPTHARPSLPCPPHVCDFYVCISTRARRRNARATTKHASIAAAVVPEKGIYAKNFLRQKLLLNKSERKIDFTHSV